MAQTHVSSLVSRPRRLSFGVALALVCALLAEPVYALTTTLKVETVSALDRTTVFPFEVLVDAHAEGDEIVYTITNKGADWPKYTLVGVFYAYGIGVVANQRIKLKTGETYTLRGELLDHLPGVLEFRINADWINQEFVMRGMPAKKPAAVEQAERATGATVR